MIKFLHIKCAGMGILEVFFDAKVTKTLVLCSDKIFAALTLDNRFEMKKVRRRYLFQKKFNCHKAR